MFLSLFSSLFCQTPFAGLLLWQGDRILADFRPASSGGTFFYGVLETCVKKGGFR